MFVMAFGCLARLPSLFTRQSRCVEFCMWEIILCI